MFVPFISFELWFKAGNLAMFSSRIILGGIRACAPMSRSVVTPLVVMYMRVRLSACILPTCWLNHAVHLVVWLWSASFFENASPQMHLNDNDNDTAESVAAEEFDTA